MSSGHDDFKDDFAPEHTDTFPGEDYKGAAATPSSAAGGRIVGGGAGLPSYARRPAGVESAAPAAAAAASSGRFGGLLYDGRTDVVDPFTKAALEGPQLMQLEEGSRTWDNMMYRMGAAYLTGIFAGGTYGLFEGVTKADRSNFRLRMNGILNAMGRRGARAGNALGVLTFLYSAFEAFAGMYYDRDAIVTKAAAGAATGLLYKSTAGPRRALLGTAVGAGSMGAYAAYDQIMDFVRQKTSGATQ